MNLCFIRDIAKKKFFPQKPSLLPFWKFNTQQNTKKWFCLISLRFMILWIHCVLWHESRNNDSNSEMIKMISFYLACSLYIYTIHIIWEHMPCWTIYILFSRITQSSLLSDICWLAEWNECINYNHSENQLNKHTYIHISRVVHLHEVSMLPFPVHSVCCYQFGADGRAGTGVSLSFFSSL